MAKKLYTINNLLNLKVHQDVQGLEWALEITPVSGNPVLENFHEKLLEVSISENPSGGTYTVTTEVIPNPNMDNYVKQLEWPEAKGIPNYQFQTMPQAGGSVPGMAIGMGDLIIYLKYSDNGSSATHFTIGLFVDKSTGSNIHKVGHR